LPASVLYAIGSARLACLGRVDSVQANTLSRDLKRVAVDDARLAGDVGENRDRAGAWR
jgi:hypothetical protein